MKKLTILAIILCLILTFGLVGCKDDDKQSNDNTGTDASGTGVGGSVTTEWDLSSLYGGTGSYKCTAQLQSPQGSGAMTIWIKGNKERIEFQSPQGTIVSIYDSEKMYTWSEGQTQGIIITLSDLENLADQVPQGTETRSLEDFNKNAVDVECNEEAVPNGLLIPSSNIQFMDMAEMLANLQNMPSM